MTKANRQPQQTPSDPPAPSGPQHWSEDLEKARRLYRFSLKCGNGDGEIKVLRVGDVSGGTRFHLTYLGGRIFVDEAKRVLREFDEHGSRLYPLNGKRGRVLSGGDWVLVRHDGVAVFDARLTFRMDDGFVFDVIISGLAPIPSWPRLEGTISVALPVRFEAAQLTDNWIAEKYRKQGERFHEYKELVRHQGEAVGSIVLAEDRLPRVDLEFLQVVPKELQG